MMALSIIYSKAAARTSSSLSESSYIINLKTSYLSSLFRQGDIFSIRLINYNCIPFSSLESIFYMKLNDPSANFLWSGIEGSIIFLIIPIVKIRTYNV